MLFPFDQSFKFARVVCRERQSLTELTFLYSLVSSAYNAALTLPTVSPRRSLIKIVNNNGPNRLPCGTLEVTGAHCDATPSKPTLWARLVKWPGTMQLIVPGPHTPLAWPRQWYDRLSRMLLQNPSKSHQSECSYLKLSKAKGSVLNMGNFSLVACGQKILHLHDEFSWTMVHLSRKSRDATSHVQYAKGSC